jgi:putative membrane protein
MKEYFFLALKGIGMGAANVIPGVSGGTIALITGIFEKLINSIKSINLKALKLLFSGKFKLFAEHINLYFLISVFTGIAIALFSLARLLEYLFLVYPVWVWAFFFGLILTSVYFVAKTVKKWSVIVIVFFITGAGAALCLSVLSPASENNSIIYLFVCGVVAACSMILPGLSGSFVLLLMGNYQLVMIESINTFNLTVLLPVAVGAGVGLLGFSYILSWIFKKFRDHTISVLSGFMLGSLLIIWPWKIAIYKTDALGNLILKPNGDEITIGYNYLIPESFSSEVAVAVALMIAGGIIIWLMETYALKAGNNQ